GDEEFLVARAVQRAVNAATAGAGEGAAVHDAMAADLTPDDLVELTSPSLFGDTRVVVVRAAHDATKDLAAALTSLAETADEAVELVVVHAGGAKGKALLEALRRVGGTVVEVPRSRSARDGEA